MNGSGERMRVCLLSASIMPGGGIAAMLRTLSNGLADAGHEVCVVHCDGGQERPAGFDPAVAMRRVRDRVTDAYADREAHGRFYRAFWRLRSLANQKLSDELAEIIVRFEPQVIHTHETRGFPVRLWQEIKRRVPARLVHTCHDIELLSPVHDASLNPRNSLTRQVLRTWSSLYRDSSGAVDALIAPSSFMLEQHKSAGLFRNAKMHVIGNAAESTATPKPLSVADTDGPLKIAYLGRLVSLKGVIELCEAVAGIVGEGAEVELRIAGDGPLRDRISGMVEAHAFMSYEGKLDGLQKTALLNWAHLVAVPTQGEESFGLVAAEAMCAARPVLASGRGGLSEVVTDGVTGWVCREPDSAGISKGLRRILAQVSELPKFSRRCLAESARFSLEEFVTRHEVAYRGAEQ